MVMYTISQQMGQVDNFKQIIQNSTTSFVKERAKMIKTKLVIMQFPSKHVYFASSLSD